MRIAAESATLLGAIPLAWLAVLHLRGQDRDIAWWWLAIAFALSLAADNASRWVEPWIISAVYPVSQAGLIGAVFLDRKDATLFLVVLFWVGLFAIIGEGVTGPDLLLRTVAWGTLAGIVWPRRGLGRLRLSLLVYFGLGCLAWWSYAAWPGWSSWGLYQGTRLAGITLFCLASPVPSLRILPRAG